MDPERITRGGGGVISLTNCDSRRGSLGAIFRFLSLCVSVHLAGLKYGAN